jgi:TolB protein
MKKIRTTTGILALFFVAWATFAEDVIPIVKPGSRGTLSVDLSAMEASGGNAALVFRKTLEQDLIRSGWFTLAEKGYGTIAVAGKCADSGAQVTAACSTKNSVSGKSYLSKAYSDDNGNAQRLAHKAADDIVLAVKGVRGIASTRIVMVRKIGGKKDVYICDADGANATQITRDGAICLALNWAPDGNSFTYTSYCGGFPDVYLVNMATYKRKRILQYPGLNMGADISPGGDRIAAVLSKDGNPDLYITDINGGNPVRLTNTKYEAEASPSWSPDGKEIVYVSNKSGLPNLYITSAMSGQHKRITFRGSENVSPDWGPDGKITYSSKRDGKFHICIFDPAAGKDEQLTSEYADDEDPSWAPDGKHIVFSRTAGYHSDLYVLDTMRNPPVRLTTMQGDWSSPAWSPK